MPQVKKNSYGSFSDDGKSFQVSRPYAPRPWLNVLCPAGGYGVALSQTGSGFSWGQTPSAPLTLWDGDLLRDTCGRGLYIKDEETGEIASVGFEPARTPLEAYECLHGIGFSVIQSTFRGLKSHWLVFVPVDESLEVWRWRISNSTKKVRRLTLCSFVEWRRFSTTPLEDREIPREVTWHDKKSIVLANHRSSRGNGWVSFHGVNAVVHQGYADRQDFLGAYGSLRSPAALARPVKPTVHPDGRLAAFSFAITLKPGEERSLLLTLGVATSTAEALVKARKFKDFSQVDLAWNQTEAHWDRFLDSLQVKTPDVSFNRLTGTWLKYQALSAWPLLTTGSRLQNETLLVSLWPEGARRHILHRSARQSVDGALRRDGVSSGVEDVSLPSLISAYVKETGLWEFLFAEEGFVRRSNEASPGKATLYDHGLRSLERALSRLSPRGLPRSGDGVADSAYAALELAQVLMDWSELILRAIRAGVAPGSEKSRGQRFAEEARTLRDRVNQLAWDGSWYQSGVNNEGDPLGSHKSTQGKMCLDVQVLALLTQAVHPAARVKKVLNSLEKHLYSTQGPVSLAAPLPAGTRGAGQGSNGGVETVSAARALRMECGRGARRRVGEWVKLLSPAIRSEKNPDVYRAEPFAMPSWIDGPASPTPGRAGGPWDAEAAAAVYGAFVEGVLGLQPDWDGLRVKPCLPASWSKVTVVRDFRGGTYRLHIYSDDSLPAGTVKLSFNGKLLDNDLLPVTPGQSNDVKVWVGPEKQR